MGRLQKQFSFKTEAQYKQLIQLAKTNDFSSVSGLLQAIADGEIRLEVEATGEQQEALVKAVAAMQAAGEVKATKVVANLLLERGLLGSELRQQVDDLFAPLFAPWLVQIEEYISLHQPFQLSYQDAVGRLWTYTVRYAEITFREKRSYLECWCEETEGNQDLPSLQHNWSLRLDRIAEAGIVPTKGEWRDRLDTISVDFELLGGLAHAYTERDNDVEVEWVSVDPPRRRVVRQISNTFWFVREILPYGKDCIVLEPDPVRQLVLDHYLAARKR